MTPHDAVLYIAAITGGVHVPSQATIRQWIARGHITRTALGICPLSIQEWWDKQQQPRQRDTLGRYIAG